MSGPDNDDFRTDLDQSKIDWLFPLRELHNLIFERLELLVVQVKFKVSWWATRAMARMEMWVEGQIIGMDLDMKELRVEVLQ